MDSSTLTPEQARRMCVSLRRSLKYLVKLRRRMELVGFPPDDPLYLDARHAQQALQDLHVRAHYCSVKTGVGRSASA